MPCSAAAAAPGLIMIDADSGLHGLSVTQRYFFETKGYLVLPDMLSPNHVDEMNAAVDACADRIQRRDWGDARGSARMLLPFQRAERAL